MLLHIVRGVGLALLIILGCWMLMGAPLYIYIIAGVAVIGVVVYFLVYKLYLNAALNNENHRRVRIPSLYQVVIVILVAAGVASMIYMSAKITDLENQVASLDSAIFRLQQNMQSMYAGLIDMQEQQESLISSIDWNYGPYDAEHQTADILITVVPKTVTDQAKLTLSFDGVQADLTENGAGIYTGTFSLGIFSEMDDAPVLTIDQDGMKQSQVINDLYISSIWSYYLPNIDVQLYSEIDETAAGETKTWNGSVSCYSSEYDSAYTIETLHMITVLNDRVISDEDLLAKPAEGSLQNGLSIELKKRESYKKTDNLLIYIEATDGKGLTYRQMVYKWYEESEWIYKDIPEIFDADGNQLLKNAF